MLKKTLYEKLVEFYQKILKTQEDTVRDLDINPVEIEKELKTPRLKEGFPLIEKADVIIDIPSSVKLFEAICHIGKTANEKMRDNIQAIEEGLAINAINLKQMLKRHSDELYLNTIAEEFNIDRGVLSFLVHTSIQPSINANVEKLKSKVDLKNWLRGYCPVCGSTPCMSELKGEGQRYFLCSFCGFQWPGERLKCPFCENRDQEKLHYFYEEGQEAYRVDVCDSCHQYIKTVDSRKLGYEPDLVLEDISTIHLDIIASEKGFKRPVPNPWGI
jgi:FdhE protein